MPFHCPRLSFRLTALRLLNGNASLLQLVAEYNLGLGTSLVGVFKQFLIDVNVIGL